MSYTFASNDITTLPQFCSLWQSAKYLLYPSTSFHFSRATLIQSYYIGSHQSLFSFTMHLLQGGNKDQWSFKVFNLAVRCLLCFFTSCYCICYRITSEFFTIFYSHYFQHITKAITECPPTLKHTNIK